MNYKDILVQAITSSFENNICPKNLSKSVSGYNKTKKKKKNWHGPPLVQGELSLSGPTTKKATFLCVSSLRGLVTF